LNRSCDELATKASFIEVCRTINTVAQGVLGRNRSLSVDQVLRIRKDLSVAEKV